MADLAALVQGVVIDMEWIDTAKRNQNEFSESGFDDWDQFCENKKKEQAYAKLMELGYYHDSGLYGWLERKVTK